MLTEELRMKQIDDVKTLFKVLEEQSHIDFHGVITGDES
jgi:hypothetical protein